MDRGLIIFMLLGIIGGFAAAVTAIVMGWGWIIAFLLYCLTGATVVVTAAIVATAVTMRPTRNTCDACQDVSPDSSLIQVLR